MLHIISQVWKHMQSKELMHWQRLPLLTSNRIIRWKGKGDTHMSQNISQSYQNPFEHEGCHIKVPIKIKFVYSIRVFKVFLSNEKPRCFQTFLARICPIAFKKILFNKQMKFKFIAIWNRIILESVTHNK